MTRNFARAMALALFASGVAGMAAAQSGPPIYGSQMMTDRERSDYHGRMRSADSVEQRERIRSEHHEQMKLRAAERGVTLPDDPPARGMRDGQGPGSQGMGPGGGMGRGMGGRPGDGMGPGSGRGR